MNLPVDECRARFASARVARLATSVDGRPHLVPVVCTVDDERIYIAIDHKPKARRDVKRLANITANPLVSLLADEYDDDWTALWWVRADGDAVIVDDPDAMRAPIDRLAAKYPQYRETRPAGPLIVVTVRVWRGWSWR